MKIAFVFIMIFLAVVGFCDVIHKLKELILKPKNLPKMCLYVKLNGKDDNDILYWLSDRICWYGGDFFGKVVALKDPSYEIVSEEFFRKKGISFVDITNFSQQEF